MAPLQPKGGHFGLILPLCTSSATLGLALFQYPVFLSFQQAKPSIMGAPLSRFWEPFFKTAGSMILATGVTSAIAGIVSARWLHTHTTLETTAVSQWYIYGAAFAAGHFVFVPFLAEPINKMIAAGKEEGAKSEGDVEQENKTQLNNWLFFHTLRTVLLDVPALVCFAEGAALSFWII